MAPAALCVLLDEIIDLVVVQVENNAASITVDWRIASGRDRRNVGRHSTDAERQRVLIGIGRLMGQSRIVGDGRVVEVAATVIIERQIAPGRHEIVIGEEGLVVDLVDARRVREPLRVVEVATA